MIGKLKMIKLVDLLDRANIDISDCKIHCATGTRANSPLDAFFDGKFKRWQEEQNKKNFECGHILSLIHLGNDRWLFAGIYKVHDVKPRRFKGKDRFLYITEEITGLEHLTGKAIIQFKKDFRASYLKAKKYANQLILKELRDQRMTIGDFPGYNSILLSYKNLKTVIRETIPSWKSALSNIAGIYLLTDTSNGKHYVGSAYNGEGIWKRWSNYAKNGHGDNMEIRRLLSEKNNEHAEHFQFSLLEVCDLNASKNYILSREAHWKNVLRSREFGLNSN